MVKAMLWPWRWFAVVAIVSGAVVAMTPLLFRVMDFVAGDLQVLDGPREFYYKPSFELLACLVVTICTLVMVPCLAKRLVRPWLSISVALLILFACAWAGLRYARHASQVAADSIVENGPGACVWPQDIPLLVVGLPGPLIALALAWTVRLW